MRRPPPGGGGIGRPVTLRGGGGAGGLRRRGPARRLRRGRLRAGPRQRPGRRLPAGAGAGAAGRRRQPEPAQRERGRGRTGGNGGGGAGASGRGATGAVRGVARRAGIRDDAGGTHHAVGRRRRFGGRRLVASTGRGRAGVGGRGGTLSEGRRFGGARALRLGAWPATRLLGLGLGLGFLDDRVATKPFGVGQTPDAVRGRIVDARRVALDADLQALGEVEHDLVLDAELSRQLVDPDLLRGQAHCLCFLYFVSVTCPVLPLTGTRRRRPVSRVVARSRHSRPVCAAPGPAALPPQCLVEARHRVGPAQSQAPLPGPAPGSSPAGERWMRTSSVTPATRRHPMQVRTAGARQPSAR